MMSKAKLRKQRHQKKMAEAIELKRRKQVAKKLGLTLNQKGQYVAPKTKSEFREYKPDYSSPRPTQDIPSLVTTGYNCYKPEKKVYTGTLVKGIATMHKSNAVPIINQEQAEDIAKMRRG
jgi:hypothetical protein